MSHFPETRYSLLARLECADDEDAWRGFDALYRPIVYRIARRRGLQDADAEDVAQHVLCAVGRAIKNWQPDPARGRFRSWLATIAQNATINALARRPLDIAAGGTKYIELFQDVPGKACDESDEFSTEWRRSVFRLAARRIRAEFRDGTWNAFWLSMVDGREVSEVSLSLNMSAGAVYAARSRIMRRLRHEILALEVDVKGCE